MSTLSTSNSTRHVSARPPVWFRYGVVAMATLILCSCRAADPRLVGVEQPPSPAPQSKPLKNESSVMPVSLAIEHANEGVVNAIYESDPQAKPVQVQPASFGVESACPTCQPMVGDTCGCAPGCGLGPAPADEYLCDGGDFGLPAAVRKDWQIDGLEQEDTVAHYDTVDGRTVVTPSNRVCIYAPRFSSVRRVVDLHEYARFDMAGGMLHEMSLARIDEEELPTTSLNRLEPSINRAERPPSLMAEEQKPGELALDVELREFRGSLAPYADLSIIRAGVLVNDEKALVAEAVQAAITWSSDQAVQITLDSRQAQAEVSLKQAGVVYHQDQPNNPKLRLVKLASTGAALPGEEVEFTLRFDNIGDRVIGNVTIVDNLTTRLEYVPGSAKASVDADFTAIPNQNGSAVMRWEIIDPVEAGEGGILQFKCRVR